MRVVLLAVVAALLPAVLAQSATAQYHSGVYIGGGYNGTTSSLQTAWGIFRYDANAGTMTTVTIPGGNCHGIAMDFDNRSLVFAVQRPAQVVSSGPEGSGAVAIPGGVESGLYRWNPTNGQISTIVSNIEMFFRAGKICVNQDGDYVIGSRTKSNGYVVFKVDQAGAISTILGTPQLGRAGRFDGAIRIDPDTGHYLVCDYTSNTTSSIRYPVLEVQEDGTSRNWSTGGAYGWDGRYSAPYDLRTGEIAGPSGSYVYRLTPGVDARTTLGTIVNLASGTQVRVAEWDLQSAPSRRWVAVGYEGFSNDPYENVLYHIDEVSRSATATFLSPKKMTINHDLVFWRGRHLQTVKTGPRQWDLRVSAPAHAGQRYAVAMSMRGIRPGTLLPDGRRLLLNIDTLALLTLGNWIPGVFRPGPGVLDANGEAVASIDVRGLPEIGWPFWIGAVVLDPAGPAGIGLVPDPIVIRL